MPSTAFEPTTYKTNECEHMSGLPKEMRRSNYSLSIALAISSKLKEIPSEVLS